MQLLYHRWIKLPAPSLPALTQLNSSLMLKFPQRILRQELSLSILFAPKTNFPLDNSKSKIAFSNLLHHENWKISDVVDYKYN